MARNSRNSLVPLDIARANENPELSRALSSLSDTVRFLGPFTRPMSWARVTFGDGWQNLTGSPTAYQLAEYRKDPLNRVWLRGVVERASGSSSTMVILPAGFRPKTRAIFATITDAGLGQVDVATNGEVKLISGGVLWVSLETISFEVEG